MNQFTMTDKNKRLEKVLKKKRLTKWLKPASDSDPVDFVIMEYPTCLNFSFLCKTKDYIEMVKRGENIPEELIHYVTIRNKRDRQATAKKLATNNEVMSIMYKKFRAKYPHL